jgi:hypothetical protein
LLVFILGLFSFHIGSLSVRILFTLGSLVSHWVAFCLHSFHFGWFSLCFLLHLGHLFFAFISLFFACFSLFASGDASEEELVANEGTGGLPSDEVVALFGGLQGVCQRGMVVCHSWTDENGTIEVRSAPRPHLLLPCVSPFVSLFVSPFVSPFLPNNAHRNSNAELALRKESRACRIRKPNPSKL